MTQFIITVGYFIIMFLHICLQELQHKVDKESTEFNFRLATAKASIWWFYLAKTVWDQIAPTFKSFWSEDEEEEEA
jgi:hypothetical protein